MKVLGRFLTIFVIQFFVFGSGYGVSIADDDPAKKGDKPKVVIIEGKSLSPLRVLTRPNSMIYREPNEDASNILTDDVGTFQPYFVYKRPKRDIKSTDPKGWYQVGNNSSGNVIGWMMAKDVMEWKQTMCLAYEHQGGRKRVMMFNEHGALRDMVKLPDGDRIKQAEEYYSKIEKNDIPEDFPIEALEPEGHIDIAKQFYLLPILEHASIAIGEDEIDGRLLKIASAPKTGRGDDKSGTLKNPEDPNNPEVRKEILKELKIDIVYVMDMTASMQPYIDMTLAALGSVSKSITQDAEIEKSIRFGIWGYRDSMEIQGIEFVTKNFTEELQDVDEFATTLSEKVKACSVGSVDYNEDVFAGMDYAMTETNWTDDALRIIILVGDAPSHEMGHKWNLSGQNADSLRSFADVHQYTVLALQVKSLDARAYWNIAEEQFRTLSRNRGLEGGSSSYYSVDSNDADGFTKTSRDIGEELVTTIALAKEGKSYVQAAGSSATSQSSATATTGSAIQAAMADWIGSQDGTKAPRDIIAWITDKDLIDPEMSSLEVRVLINKRQLDQLKVTLSAVVNAGTQGQISGDDLFDKLMATAATITNDPDRIKSAKRLSDAGVIPEFMQGLPYKSKIMELSNEIWASWGPDQQDGFLENLSANIVLYQAIHDSPDNWVPLNEGDDVDEYVYPISLKNLP